MHEIKVTIQFFNIAPTLVKKKLITIQVVNGNKYLNANIAPTTFFDNIDKHFFDNIDKHFFVDNKQNVI